jgi:hypothetical protein
MKTITTIKHLMLENTLDHQVHLSNFSASFILFFCSTVLILSAPKSKDVAWSPVIFIPVQMRTLIVCKFFSLSPSTFFLLLPFQYLSRFLYHKSKRSNFVPILYIIFLIIVHSLIISFDNKKTLLLLYSGRMAKIPKKTLRETFNETNYYKIQFPNEATTNQKGLLLGSSILINALYFENSE